MEAYSLNPTKLGEVLTELTRHELIFLWPESSTTPEDLDQMLAPEFQEIGASGRLYAREIALQALVERRSQPNEDVWETSDFQCQELAPELYVLTYTLVQDHVRKTRRMTIWRRVEGNWQVVFHQGTMMMMDAPKPLREA